MTVGAWFLRPMMSAHAFVASFKFEKNKLIQKTKSYLGRLAMKTKIDWRQIWFQNNLNFKLNFLISQSFKKWKCVQNVWNEVTMPTWCETFSNVWKQWKRFWIKKYDFGNNFGQKRWKIDVETQKSIAKTFSSSTLYFHPIRCHAWLCRLRHILDRALHRN